MRDFLHNEREKSCPGFRSLKYKRGKTEHRQLPGILAFSAFGCGYGQLLPVPASWDFSAIVDCNVVGAKTNPSSLSCLRQGKLVTDGRKTKVPPLELGVHLMAVFAWVEHDGLVTKAMLACSCLHCCPHSDNAEAILEEALHKRSSGTQ